MMPLTLAALSVIGNRKVVPVLDVLGEGVTSTPLALKAFCGLVGRGRDGGEDDGRLTDDVLAVGGAEVLDPLDGGRPCSWCRPRWSRPGR